MAVLPSTIFYHAWLHDATEPLKFTSLGRIRWMLWHYEPKAAGWADSRERRAHGTLPSESATFNPELRPALRKNGFLTQRLPVLVRNARSVTGRRAHASASSHEVV